MLKQMQERRGSDEGFTLIELLIAIVVVGVLSTVVILGIGGLTNNGKTSACKASRDATEAAIAVYYANTGAYPTALLGATALTAAAPPILSVATGITVTAGSVFSGPALGHDWTFVYTPGATTADVPTLGACTTP
jgi:prepilin-type N-terminal cleavage/methylation domain-containing protein